MHRSVPRSTQFAVSALIVFGTGSICILALELAEQRELISGLAESISRFLICIVLLGGLIHTARTLPRAAGLAVIVCAGFVAIELLLQVVEDFSIFDQLPLIGRDSNWRHAVERAVVCCWMSAAFYVTFMLMKNIGESYEELEDKQLQLEASNKKLKKAVQELENAQRQVVQQERLAALGQMASGVAHDLNNALTPVALYSDLLQTYDAPAELRDPLSVIRSGVDHATQVIKQLQFFYRGHTDKVVTNETVKLHDLILHAVELTRFRWYDDASKMGMEFKIVLDLRKECSVLGNRTELLQLMINLLINAIDAMPEGGRIAVALDKVEGDKLEDTVQLSVADQGIGMSSEDLQRCFEPFFTTKNSGSGLGLSVCHGIVTRHGGTIEASNQVRGCRFVVQLPIVDNAEKSPANDDDGKSGSTRPPRVLLIDDDTRVLKSLSALLNSRGISADTAESGRIGIELARSTEYDLVVSDFAMQNTTGREVVAALKSAMPNVPIVIISGWSYRQISEEFQGVDFKPDHILSKPIRVDDITDCLNR